MPQLSTSKTWLIAFPSCHRRPRPAHLTPGLPLSYSHKTRDRAAHCGHRSAGRRCAAIGPPEAAPRHRVPIVGRHQDGQHSPAAPPSDRQTLPRLKRRQRGGRQARFRAAKGPRSADRPHLAFWSSTASSRSSIEKNQMSSGSKGGGTISSPGSASRGWRAGRSGRRCRPRASARRRKARQYVPADPEAPDRRDQIDVLPDGPSSLRLNATADCSQVSNGSSTARGRLSATKSRFCGSLPKTPKPI